MAPFSDIPHATDCRQVGFLVAPGFRLAALGRALSVLAEAAARGGSSFDVTVLSRSGGVVGSAEGVRLRTRRGGAGKSRARVLVVGDGADAAVEIVGATLALVAPMASPGCTDPAAPEAGAAAPSFSRRVRAVLDYARLHLDQPLPVRTLASVACLGTRQFVRVLHRETGQTPAKLIDTMRAEVARDLIERGTETMTRIADQVGFADAERMRRACLRRFGAAPLALRRAARQAAQR